MPKYSTEFLINVIESALESGMIEFPDLDYDAFCHACGNELTYYPHNNDCPVKVFRDIQSHMDVVYG